MISRREQNKINSEKRILKASRRLFSSKGYENTMMEDIAAKAEVSKATLYNYFPNKESLLIGLVREQAEHMEDMVAKDSNRDKNSFAMLRRVLEEMIEVSAEYWDLARRITYLTSCEDSPLYNTYERIDNLFEKLIVQAQTEGTIKAAADRKEVTDVAWGIYLISQFQWDHIDKYTHEQIHEKLNKYFDILMKEYRTT